MPRCPTGVWGKIPWIHSGLFLNWRWYNLPQMLSHLRHHYLYYNHHNPLITIITITAMSLSQPFVNSELDCMILAATTTRFPLPKQEEQVKSHSGRFHRSFPNFKPSNPKSLGMICGSPVGFEFTPPSAPTKKKNPLKNRRKNSVFFSENFPEVRLPRVIVPACAGACWIAWTGQPQGRSLEGQLWWIGWKVSGEGAGEWSREKRWNWGKKLGNDDGISEWIRQGYLVAASNEFHTPSIFLMRHKNTYDSSPFLFWGNAMRNEASSLFRVVMKNLRSRAKATHQRFFSCFEDVNFPGPTSIKISCVCSSELVHWFDPAVVFRDVIVYHASRLPALNILDKLIKVYTIGRRPIQRLNGTEV